MFKDLQLKKITVINDDSMRIAYLIAISLTFLVFVIFAANDTFAYFKSYRNSNKNRVTPTPTNKPTPTPTIAPKSSTPTPTLVSQSGSKPGRINPICVSSHIEEEDLSAANIDKQLDMMKQAGVAWVRFDFVWDNLMSGPNTYDYAYYDNLVNKVNARGMGVIALVAQWGIPHWEDDPINPDHFKEFTRNIAAHYKDKIKLYEIGNEVNTEDISARDYTKWLIAGYDGIKAGNASSKVISAGLAIDDRSGVSYVQQMYDNGAKGHFDYFGMHPYSWPFSPAENNNGWGFSILKEVKAVMDKNGDSNKKIIATEFGWPSTTQSGGVSEATQGLYINDVFNTIENNPNFKYVSIACVYDFIDDGNDKGDPEHNFGVIRRDYSQKPVFNVLSQLRQKFNSIYTPINP